MRAIVCRAYGPPEAVLRVEDVEKPSPADGEVLIKVRAAAVNPLDAHLMKGKPFGFRVLTGLTGPSTTRPGRDLAGEVEAVGSHVADFQPGDGVFGTGAGAFAEYACTPARKLARKPAGVTFEQAACAPIAGLTALQALRDKGRVLPGERVLINGAAGGVGMFAVQIAKWLRAEVTGVCSTRNVDFVRSLGADRVVDYTRADFTRLDERYDLMLDCICNRPLSSLRRVLTRNGRLLVIGLPQGRYFVVMLANFLKPFVVSPFVSQKLTFFGASIKRADLDVLAELMANGTLAPAIDRRQGLAAVPRAVADIVTRHVRGKVVITL